MHPAIPEKELPLTLAATGWLYQPLESGGRDGAAEAVGVEVSTLMGWFVEPVPDGPAIAQDWIVEVFPGYEWAVQPLEGFPPSCGLHVQLTSTPLVYQPELHGVV